MKSLSKFTVFFLFLNLLCSSFTLNAQKKHFIYIQAEEKQPFYVTINNKNYSSTVNGHLIIPRLKNGKYFFIAGFPKDKYAEQKFSCVIADKDLGFVLKQYGKDGWGLFNLITFTSTMANAADWEKDKATNDTTKIDDDYTIVPTKTTPVQPATKKSVAESNDNKENSADKGTKKNNETTSANEQKPVTKKQEDTVSSSEKTKETTTTVTILRTYQKGGAQGIDEVYVDYSSNPKDTIVIFIPTAEKVEAVQQAKPVTTIQAVDTSKSKNPGKAYQYNTSCVQMATESDFAKTRKLMSLETTDEKMIVSAKKSFSNKCYYVEQIRSLGLLFLSEQSKLKFFTMAKPFIYDRLNYASLETQFTLFANIDQFRKTFF